ncbi:MAG TPA: hypothetical protein VMX38_18605 [Verrucomicrobiae bacterium]|nr:hypothetical protein [Verrucomicrobiae bacterium]
MSAAPMEHLEIQASQQRERIHRTALELMSKVDETKQQYSAANILHRNFGRASAAVSVLGFLLGFVFAGAFTRQ